MSVRGGLRCRKWGHPWDDIPDEDVDARRPFGSTHLPVLGEHCPQCGTSKFEEYRRNGRLNRRTYDYPDDYKALGLELREFQQQGETRGRAVNRRFLMERGLVKAPAKFTAPRKK